MATAESSRDVCERQKQIIKDLIQTPLKHGDSWFLIDAKWFKQWKNYVGYDSWDTGLIGDETAYPGPIDNMPLFKDGSPRLLKPHLLEDIDYMLTPADAWKHFLQWYQLQIGQEPIERKVITQGVYGSNFKVEVYLMDLKLCHNNNLDTFVTHQFSRVDTLETVEGVMRKVFCVDSSREVRLWNKYMSNTYEHLNKLDTTLQDSGFYPGHVIVLEERNADGSWPRQSKGSYSASSASSSLGGASDASKSYVSSGESSGIDSYSNNTYKGGIHPGLCGLSNLGNTCFMNSALQCMSNVPPLTDYMLSNRWKEELNRDNPLGMSGEIATTYAELIHTMWSGKYTCAVPRQFKIAVGRFKPEFSGYQQQDSQELMAFLLDGLHEDLNRIRKKPYIETRETDGRPDKEVATEAWQDYMQRNNSVIVDIFHGLLKSTLVCPECSKVSIKFDPFCYLSLPLPFKKERHMEIFFVPLSPKLRTRQCRVTVPKMGVIADLCSAVTHLTGVPPDKMVIADVYNHRFHKVFGHSESLTHIMDRDDVFVYEVNVNSANDSDTVILPVYMRQVQERRGAYLPSITQLFGQPILVTVPRENCSYDLLYQRVLQQIARYIKIPEDVDGLVNAALSTTSSDMSTDSPASKDSDEVLNDNGCPLGTEHGDPSTTSSTSNHHRLFTFHLVNSYGSTDVDSLSDDGKPIHFNNHSYLAADWNVKVKQQCYDDQEAEAIEKDASMEVKSSTSKKHSIQLRDCMELFTNMERLGEHDLWYCPACKKHQQATKKFDIWQLPPILVVHLKRFSYSRYWRDKLDTFIDIPIYGLDMTPFIINRDHGPATYDLIAISNHYGGMGGGHYTAYAKNKTRGQWIHFDDSGVSSTSEDSIITKAAYVLVYQLRGSAGSTADNDAVSNNVVPSADDRQLNSH